MNSQDLRELKTSSGKPFRYKGNLATEIIVYPSDKDSCHQERTALVITPFESNLVQDLIRKHGSLKMGASRDRPPEGSLGSFLKEEALTPQHLSYLVPILAENGECRVEQEGKAFVVVCVRKDHGSM